MVQPLRKHRAFANKNEGLFNLSLTERILQYCLFEQLLNSMQHCKSQLCFLFNQLNPQNVFKKQLCQFQLLNSVPQNIFKDINRLFEEPCGLILWKDLEYFEDTFFVDETFMFQEHEL